jgi:hypothetical protein
MTSSNTSSPLHALADQVFGLDAPAADSATPAGPTFESLGLSPEICSALTAAGY